jgi:hypothetical protein
MSLFKRDKNIHLSPGEILQKHDRTENPFIANIDSNYDKELYSPLVLAQFLKRDARFLEAILQANKGKLTEESPLYKEITSSLEMAKYDFNSAKKNLTASKAKQKNLKAKKDVNIEAELKVAERALPECQENYARMHSLKTYLDEIEKDSLPKDTCKHLEGIIKSLGNQSAELTDLARKGDLINKKYRHLWGENKENMERKLEAKEQKIDNKEIVQYEKMIARLDKLLKTLPERHEFLDEHLRQHSQEPQKGLG